MVEVLAEALRAPQIALVARAADEAGLTDLPALQHAVTHVLRDLELLEALIERAEWAACVIDGELPFVSPALLERLAARVPTLVLLPEKRLALAGAIDCAQVDFVRRPLSWTELDLRLSRLLRQAARSVGAGRLRCGALQVDPATGEVSVQGEPVKLRRLELKILVYLLENTRRWIGVDEIQGRVLGSFGDGGSVRTHIWEIRNKLARRGASNLIQSERGKGYRAVER